MKRGSLRRTHPRRIGSKRPRKWRPVGSALVLATAATACASCGSDRDDDAAAMASATATAGPTGGTSAPRDAETVYPDRDTPVAADFADTVEKSVTADNYVAKLEEMQREVAMALSAQGMKPTPPPPGPSATAPAPTPAAPRSAPVPVPPVAPTAPQKRPGLEFDDPY